jgi:multicomponent Na+:H+ antiporter subunit E
MRVTIGLLVSLAGAWILWSWHFTPLLITLGAASVALALYISHRMGIVEDGLDPVTLLPGLLVYLPWLFLEIVKSNLHVAARILNPRLPIRPHMIEVKAGQRGDVGRVIYANSITLTPGTVSVDTRGDTITVHALTDEAADGVLTGEMDRRVSRLEGGG